MSSQYIHLRTHTEFSLLNGLLRVKSLLKKVAEMGMPAVAVTDQSNLFALIKFYKAAQSAGVKPIIGADIWLDNPGGAGKPYRITLLAQNNAGYQNLIQLLSRAHLEGQHLGKAIVAFEWLEHHNAGLIALSGAREGDVGQALLADDLPRARECLAAWCSIFPERFYIELQRTGREGEVLYNNHAVALSLEFDLPIVATNDVQFMSPADFEAHEARVCIHEGRTLDDPRRARLYTEHQYLKSGEEMQALFADLPEALENTVEIARRCSVDVEMGKNYLPNYPVPEGMTIETYFRELSETGLRERMEELLDPAAETYQAQCLVYLDRLTFELDIINQMGFPGYFLIVMDFIRWARENGVPVGPGRGSGAGSLVAYSLKITDLDPITHDLLFERFLNPERVSMPDFDIDFCMDGRDAVIDYVANTYGRQAVSQIITFGTMAAKAVVRDVARVQGKPYGLADKLSKMIPFEVGMTLEKAVEQEPMLADFVQQNEEVAEIWEMALKLEGVTRNVGKHAGGVVIAPTKLTDFCPLYCDETGANLVTQFDKDDVEQAGLVKFDFLGLRTLTIIDWAVKSVNAVRAQNDEPALDITAIDLEEEPVYRLLQSGETTAIFQLESRGMKDLIRRLLPSSFEDVTALVALFRPGPLQSGMVDDFINRKHGRAKVEYLHTALEEVLDNTYGVILYQEQVMKIAQVLAKYSLGQADMLRRAMGKKKAEEMAKQRQIFSEGARNNEIPEQVAGLVFDLMEKFAGYGFNKSHSAAYALLSYQTAWLKCHYPGHFMAAVMSADMQNTDKVVILVEDCRQLGLSLVLPDVNRGQYRFVVNPEGEVVYGLGAIKGLGEGPVDAVIAAREEGGQFTDLFDFCVRVDLRKVNRRALEALIRAGALDHIGPHRAIMLRALDEAIKAAGQHAHNRSAGMTDLFGTLPGAANTPQQGDPYIEYVNVRPWSEKVRLQSEKETLGLYLRGHPIDEYERELRKIARDPLVALKPGDKDQWVAGLVVGLRTMKSKRGDTIAFVTLDDRSARVEVSVFAETYDRYRELLVKDTILVVEGGIANDDYSGALKVRAKRVMDMVTARSHFANELLLRVEAGELEGSFVADLEKIIQPFQGDGCALVVEYSNAQARGRLLFSQDWRISPSDDLIHNLREHFGARRVQLRY